MAGMQRRFFIYLPSPPVLYRGISIRAYERPRTGGNGSGPSLVPVEHAGVDGDDGKDAVISFFFFFFNFPPSLSFVDVPSSWSRLESQSRLQKMSRTAVDKGQVKC